MRRDAPRRYMGWRAAISRISLIALMAFTAEGALAEKPKVAVVDVQRVINESVIGKAGKNSLIELQKKEETKLKTLEDQLRALQADIEKQSAVLSGAALEEKTQSLRKKEREAQLNLQESKEALIRRSQQQVGDIVRQIDKAVQRIASQEQYRFVLEKDPSFVVYAGDSLDLTKKVIELLDAEKVG